MVLGSSRITRRRNPLAHLLAVIVASVQGGQAEVLWRQVEDVEAALGAGRSWVEGVGRC